MYWFRAAANYHKTPITRALLEPILGRGLLTSEGSFWRRQRRIAAPAFHHRKIVSFANLMVSSTRDMLARWEEPFARGAPVELQEEMSRVTLQIITRAMFSDRIGGDEARGVSRAMHDLNKQKMRFSDFIGLPEWVPRLPRRATRSAVQIIDRSVNRIIAERRADGRDHDDLLSMFMQAEDAETGEKMTDRQLRDEVVTMFIAGHETTATALVWTFYALHCHREVEERLHAEVDGVLDGRPPELGDLANLPWTRMVIEESMRLYPVVPMISRRALGDDTIKGIRVPKGTQVYLNIWLAHRDPDIWPDPERFDPERFDPTRANDRPKHAYFPFGGGPRICIGKSFAMMEAQLLLAMIAQSYRLRLADGYEVHPSGTAVLRPRGGLPMTLERRHTHQGGSTVH